MPYTFGTQNAPSVRMPTKQMYGSMPYVEDELGSGAPLKDGLVHLSLHPEGGQRARIDVCQTLVNAFLPVAIFAITAAVLSFSLHYNFWPFAWLIAFACVLPGLYAFYLARKAYGDNANIQGNWMMLLCGLCMLAWLSGLLVGDMNYSTNMLPFYEMSGLNYYPSVDPSVSGQSHIDAGRILFQPGSHLDINRAMGVRISKNYCVAPVVNPNAGTDVEWDYWAVGVDCCSSIQPQKQWTCGEINNPMASAGMRWMTDAERPFYRMAVQEAEATYKLRAKHPIFIHWMQDPAAKMALWRDGGVRMYVEGVCSIFVLMFFLSFASGLWFSRASMESHPCKGAGFHKYVNENPDHDFLEEEGYEWQASSMKSLTV
jgi:hypothetical protein